MGNKVTVKNINSGKQFFLSGHTNLISALCVSPCGKFIASGQINHLGFKVIQKQYNKKNIYKSESSKCVTLRRKVEATNLRLGF